MKKGIISILILAVSAGAYAGSFKTTPALHKHQFLNWGKQNSFKESKEICTVTITGSVGVGSTSISVSCTATASTCDAAATDAINCVNSTIKAVKRAIM